MKPGPAVRHVAIVVARLGDNWLGGVNYYRNLVAVFDAAADPSLRLHLLVDDAGFLGDMPVSERVLVHVEPMLQRRTAAWALRQLLLKATGRDLRLVARLRELGVRAVLFKYVPGAQAGGITTVPWIPDFQSQHHPELFPPHEVAAEKHNAQVYVRDADGLIVSSQAAADDAMRLFGAQPQRLHVLRFAPKMDFEPLQSTAVRDEVFARHGIDRPYVFLPNQYWQHKNHALVAQALQLLKQQGRPAPLVVSTGKTEDPRKPGHFESFREGLQAQGLQGQYRILGVIPRRDMMVLMAHAMAVLNPSRFEGWSTTVEEAKALGKALLVSDLPVHREQVAGRPGARLFGVDDAAALATLLADLQQENAGRGPAAHPPRPEPQLYSDFLQQYLQFIHRIAGSQR